MVTGPARPGKEFLSRSGFSPAVANGRRPGTIGAIPAPPLSGDGPRAGRGSPMSSTDATTPSPVHPDGSWEILAGRLEAFVAAWDGGPGPPDLAGFLPPGPAGLRRLALVELIK